MKEVNKDYSRACEERSKEIIEDNKTPEERVMKEMNAKYAIIHTKTTNILVEKDNQTFVLDSRQSLVHFFEDDSFIDSEGNPQNKAKYWLKQPNKRKFTNIVFNPAVAGHYDGNYNIFKGFAVTPQKGDCSLYWSHVRDVICNGNIEHYQYVRKWMASIVQNPEILATALVLRGEQGTGKNVFVQYFGDLFGRHFLPLTSLDQITGRFNGHLQDACLLFANEAIWGGSKKDVGALKALITDPIIFIEAKGKDGYPIANCRHLIICSNEALAAPIDLDDRRFFCLNVSASRKGDRTYFKALVHQMDSHGKAALLYDLKNEDLTGFEPAIMPSNDSGFDMKMKSASTSVKYIYEALKAGCWEIDAEVALDQNFQTIACQRMFHNYKNWCEDEGFKSECDAELGKSLKKLIPSVYKERPSLDGKRIRAYCFPSLVQCRKEFERFTKQTPKIWDDVQD